MSRRFGLMAGLIALLLAAAARPAMSQEQAAPPAVDAQYQRIQGLILMRLSTVLGLSSDQTQHMGRILTKYHQRKKQLRREVSDLTAQLRSAIAAKNNSQTQAVLAKLDEAKRQLRNVNEDQSAEARQMLNPQQQAQFLLVMDEVKSEIRSVRERDKGGDKDKDKDRPASAGKIPQPGSNPYVPGSPYFPTPAFQPNQ